METECPAVRRRILILLNPRAGQGTALTESMQHIAARTSLRLHLISPDPTDQDLQMEQARAAIEQGVDAVVVHGGDGMVGTAIGLVAGLQIPVGIVPTGTGNDFARAAEIPRTRPREALENILQALEQPEVHTTAVDVLHVSLEPADGSRSQRWAANSVNIGFDAAVNRRANELRHVPGSLRYIIALAQTVQGFRPITFAIGIEDEPEAQYDAALVCIQNGPFIGGGIPLAPGADLTDGMAEVSLVTSVPRPALVALFPLLYLRRHAWLKPLSQRRAGRVCVTVPAGVPVFADGDQVISGRGEECRVEITVASGAVQLLK